MFLPVRRELYEEASERVMAVLRSLVPQVEVLGWDEAFLGVDAEDPEAVARQVQQAVRQATAPDCTVGIGRNRLQAKLATGFGKPGIFRITGATWFEVLGDKPVDALWGIGSKTAKKLGQEGISTVSQLAAADPEQLARRFGPMTGPWLVRLAQGRDSATVGTPWVARSRSREITFQQDLADWDQVRREVAELARRVADDVAAEDLPAARVVVKVRYAPFTTQTHGQALPAPTSDAEALESAALVALESFPPGRPVRLLGVRAEFAT
ncbi:DNA polymerase IV [Kineosporiaceae bacterium SCSIO 59966]|nr:DNA polymerase IV [Kineosporiaceae bacterium SCSIO 59966]